MSRFSQSKMRCWHRRCKVDMCPTQANFMLYLEPSKVRQESVWISSVEPRITRLLSLWASATQQPFLTPIRTPAAPSVPQAAGGFARNSSTEEAPSRVYVHLTCDTCLVHSSIMKQTIKSEDGGGRVGTVWLYSPRANKPTPLMYTKCTFVFVTKL